MLPLHELQERFAAALFEGEVESIAQHVRGDGLDPEARLDIYRNNLREGFRKALALEFPVIERLVGDAFFRQLTLEFLSAHPSRSGDLHHIGEPFATFLRKRFAGSEYAYFADVAALEWAYQEVLIAPDVPPLDIETLRALDPARYDELRFELNPACRLIASSFPIVRIWSVNQPDITDEEIAAANIDLGSGGDCVLVRRTAEGVELLRLPSSQYTLLAALASGETLGDALDAAQSIADPTFDLGSALQRFVTLGALSRAYLA